MVNLDGETLMVDASKYEEFVDTQCRDYVDFNYAVVALGGEAGEVLEWHKKRTFRGNEAYTDQMLLEEFGDVLFYLTKAAGLKGWSLEQVANANIDKLEARRKVNGVIG